MSSKMVLLVEDNPDDVELTLRSFKRNNLDAEVAVAWDGQEALDFLLGTGRFAGRDLRQMPVLILLDLKLPRLDGFEVLEQIRRHASTRHIPVVILTTSAQNADKVRSYDLGANSFVRKPVNFDNFHDAARQLGDYWLTINDAPPIQETP